MASTKSLFLAFLLLFALAYVCESNEFQEDLRDVIDDDYILPPESESKARVPHLAAGSQSEGTSLEEKFNRHSKRKIKQDTSDSGTNTDSDETEGAEHAHSLKEDNDPNSKVIRPQSLLPGDIKQEELLDGKNRKDQYSLEPLAKESKSAPRTETSDIGNQQPFALFTIANTNVGIPYEQLPYREKYQWQQQAAPCHTFNLRVPDELAEKSMIKLCIFRPNLEFPDETQLFIVNSEEEEKLPQQKVLGFVMNTTESSVYGRIIDGQFYGEISITDESRNIRSVFVIEEISLLNRLMRYNPKTLRHMLMVMLAKDKNEKKLEKPVVYNAVVTKGASLVSIMANSGTGTFSAGRNPFLMFSTSHNSYISSGEPSIKVDEEGQVQLESGNNSIHVDNEGSIKIYVLGRRYTFRPNGRTIVQEGNNGFRTLQEHEGSVAITASTSSSTYDCVLPTPAFEKKRKGGYVCKVCLAMDDTFKEHYIKHGLPNDTDLSENYLGLIIDRVSWILRSTDFDGDYKPDNIGLDYEPDAVRWTYPDIGGESVSEKDIEVLFQALESYSFADCCLGMGFTMKSLPKEVPAKRSQVRSGPNGVCAGRTGRIASNLVIISANSNKGHYQPIREDQLIHVTANQVAGSFGAKEDGSGNDLCDQFSDDIGVTRHYLMWPDMLRDTTLKEQALSSCSRSAIMKTMSTCKSSCFEIDKHPFCGNGIVEEGEECDCGSEENCLSQTCCISRSGVHPCRKTGFGCTSGAKSTLTSPGTLSAVVLLYYLLKSFHNLRNAFIQLELES